MKVQYAIKEEEVPRVKVNAVSHAERLIDAHGYEKASQIAGKFLTEDMKGKLDNRDISFWMQVKSLVDKKNK
jgi:hypothetical protein